MNDATVRLSPRLRYRKVGNEGVLVHLENARVLVVNEVGVHCVQLLEKQPMSPADLADAVAQEFDVDAQQAHADVVLFLEQLHKEKALDAVDASSSL